MGLFKKDKQGAEQSPCWWSGRRGSLHCQRRLPNSSPLPSGSVRLCWSTRHKAIC